MIDGIWEGLVLAVAWPAPLYLLIGILIGIWVGAVPGLGGAVGLALLLPFTFGMDTVPAFALLLGMYAVTATSDSITSILFGIPGTVASQATILDGYPLAKKGQAARAFGAAYTVSAIGGLIGAVLLGVSLPIILPFINAFGVPEFFMLSVLGLTMVGVLSGRSLLKGITVACFGLLLTTVGYANATGVPRFYFGVDYLLDGIPIIPIVLGLFGIPELMELAVKNTSISRVASEDAPQGSMRQGIRDVFEHRWLTLRSSVLGTYIGMLPGLGAAIVDWIAYGHAVQSAKDKSQFGHGDIRGLIAPEAANNAHKSGALIPTVAFGIPGSIGTAILLGALVIKGLRPGPDMLTINLGLTFSMVWEIAIANLIAAGLLLLFTRQVYKLAFLPGHLIVPGVMTVLLMGAWIATNSIGDWWVALAMGTIGYVMKQGGWPRPPLILALVLGVLMEDNYQLSTQIYGEYAWLYSRPVVVVIEALIVLTVVLALRGVIKPKPKESSEAGEGAAINPLISLPVTAGLAALFFLAYTLTGDFAQRATAQFPHAILVVGIPLVLLVLVQDVRASLRAVAAAGGFGPAWSTAVKKAELAASAVFLGFLLATFGLSYLAGQLVALPVFVALYLLLWGAYRWPLAFGYALGAALVVWGFYGQLMGLLLHESLLFG
ncbi:MAG TPA: tripartite tricarboxylate transporter permease [Gammaproteobacteria bacterium]|nr:tripartite tricarboxylate transporter permease [Gammaproteobacteria bacterium]